MFLKSMTLHNFRCFSDLKVNFNNRLTVLVGNNGAGKSTVLEAAAIAAGTLTSAMDGLTNYGIKKSDAHYKCFDLGSNVDVQPQFPVEITAVGTIDGQEISWAKPRRLDQEEPDWIPLRVYLDFWFPGISAVSLCEFIVLFLYQLRHFPQT